MNNKQSRRNFIKNAGLAGAAITFPTIIPASALSTHAPSNQINIGLIATGRQAIKVNLKQFLSMDNVRVIAVNDPDHWRMQQAADIINNHYSIDNQTYKGVQSYNDYRELLQNKDIDAVMISSPDHWHVPQGIAAAQAGKHIAMEKALSICINHSKALVESIVENNVHHRLDSEFRSKENFSTAVGLLRAGAIGKINKVIVGVPSPLNGSAPDPQPTMPVPEELDYDQWLGPAYTAPYTMRRVHEPKTYDVRPGWMRIDDYCNGMITNWGAHLIDIALWGIDKEYESPVSVEGDGRFTQSLWNTIESFNLTYQFADGMSLEYIIDEPYVKFEGEDGWIKAAFKKPLEASDPSILQHDIAPQFKNVVSDKQDFINSIIQNKESLEPMQVGHNVYRLCNMGLLSIKLGRKLNWNSAKDKFENDNAANTMLYRPFRKKYIDKSVVDWLEKYQSI